jgi:SAM-dependent methyltransferase
MIVIPATYSFERYLAAKRAVDDRALNRRVWAELVAAVRRRPPGQPLRLLEVGAGIGTMVERLLEWDLLAPAAAAHPVPGSARSAEAATITAIDARPENVAEARRRLPRWAAEHGFGVDGDEHGRLVLRCPDLYLALDLEAIDLFDFAARERGRRAWDLVMANAVLDDLDVPTVLPALFALVQPGGLFYFSITFDGVTAFEPEIDRALDDRIEALYHETMDLRVAGKPSGDSRAGRHLFARVREAGGEVLDMGASDWVIFPGPDGYPGDEAYFLRFIVDTVGTALAGHPELDPERLADWVRQRHAQIERAELVYIAHQLDVFGRVPANTRL